MKKLLSLLAILILVNTNVSAQSIQVLRDDLSRASYNYENVTFSESGETSGTNTIQFPTTYQSTVNVKSVIALYQGAEIQAYQVTDSGFGYQYTVAVDAFGDSELYSPVTEAVGRTTPSASEACEYRLRGIFSQLGLESISHSYFLGVQCINTTTGVETSFSTAHYTAAFTFIDPNNPNGIPEICLKRCNKCKKKKVKKNKTKRKRCKKKCRKCKKANS